jgi:hypothetical protein
VAKFILNYMLFVVNLVESTGLVKLDHHRAVVEHDYFGQTRELLKHPEDFVDTPQVGVVMFDERTSPLLMASIYGGSAPIWGLLSCLAVWYRPDQGNKNFVFLKFIDTVWFWGSIGLWGSTFFFFLLALIPTATFRFIFWLWVLISAVGGPWGGWWVAFIIYTIDYVENYDAYLISDIFLDLFLRFCWDLILTFLAIDTLGPVYKWYEKLAIRAAVRSYERPTEKFGKDLALSERFADPRPDVRYREN